MVEEADPWLPPKSAYVVAGWPSRGHPGRSLQNRLRDCSDDRCTRPLEYKLESYF